MKTTKAQGPDARPDARAAAMDILYAVTVDARLMAEAAPAFLEPLEAPDRARASRLASETLRWAQRADRLIGRFLRQKPPDDVLNALRLGTIEMHVAGEAPHGVVSSLVSLVRKRTGEPGLARLTNAVLRKISTADVWNALPIPELPKPIRKRLVSSYGKGRVSAIEAVHAQQPPLDLTPKKDSDRVAAATGGQVLPTGSVRIRAAGRVSALEGFETGDWWVQDAAAALPVRLLSLSSGMRVLDLCAAPGGKTMQLAASGAQVTALDISEDRLAVLEENLTRTRLTANVVAADALTWVGGPFDAILLDAPCSATGTIRRHPDLPHAKREMNLEPLLKLQARLLDRAVALLAHGGTLIYCTCSLFVEEGEKQVEAFLERQADLRLDPVFPGPGIDPAWLLGDGTLRVTPESWADVGGIDGFFIARLVRAS